VVLREIKLHFQCISQSINSETAGDKVQYDARNGRKLMLNEGYRGWGGKIHVEKIHVELVGFSRRPQAAKEDAC
jgi:hypothetical protein